MEILYIYIQEFGGRIIDQGLNFGGEFRFSYDRLSGTLIVKENPFHILGFFNLSPPGEQKAMIKNVTAIIGQNGAGKTTILNFIRSNFVRGLNGIRSPVIIILRNNQNQTIAYHFSELPIRAGNYKTYDIDVKPIGPKTKKVQPHSGDLRFELTEYQSISEFDSLDFIFFSNIFDGDLQIEFSGLYDLSTNYLIRQDLATNLQNHFINAELNHREVELHNYEDIERQIAFINGYDNQKVIAFDPPELLFVSSKRDLLNADFAFDRFERSQLEQYKFLDLATKLVEITKDSIDRQGTPSDKAVAYFSGLALVNFILEIAINYNALSTENLFFFRLTDPLPEHAGVADLAGKLILQFKQQWLKFNSSIDTRTSQWIEGLLSYINFLQKLIPNNYIVTDSANSFAINIRDQREQFKQFYQLYARSYLLRPSLNFTWGGLSSGEKAILKMYSRFFSLSNSQVRAENSKLQQDIIIMIDEGDLYLHPGWQKEFIYILLDFLSDIYSETPDGKRRKIQIILTTNSPIPSSDLPNTNIIFLEKKDKVIVIRDSLDDKRATFGANIHTLLADSFYLRDGMIGNFARHKINNIIEILQGDFKAIEAELETIQNTIAVIGEPIIRTKLLQMLQERLSLNQANLQSRVAELDRRVRHLEGRNNQPNNS